LTDHSKALAAIEERRHAAANVVLTKDADPTPFTKADGETGIVEGFSTRYWVVDSYGEFTVPGAFSKSIAERGPGADKQRILLRYEHEHTIGKHTEMVEEADGVRIKAKISDDGMFGSAVRAHLKDDVPYGLSIGFRRVASRPAQESDPLIWDHAPDYIRQMAMDDLSFVTGLTEIKHLEDSIVTFPAVDNALVTDYRSTLDLTQRALDRLMADVKAGRLTDDHITHLRQIASGLPAGTTPDAGETPDAPRISQAVTVHRNYQAEARLALLSAGVPIEGFV
jgi:HK97 family phage prohead protease